ncbi:hypothetical protein [Dysgonomonas capnocytophagoides]|uniref:hypothetical protein n=1 Tax=Dysgonomonas capnocytophagoides TaxID=45254 RepID=UPI003995A6C1
MKKSIGIRVAPDCIYYSIIEQGEDVFNLILVDKIKIAKNLDFPEQLKILRTTLLDIINENDINKACIRVTENVSRNISISRISIEGVVQELIASSKIERYKVVQLANIASILGLKVKEVKETIDDKLDFKMVEQFSKYKKEEKESILSAICASKI